MQQCNCKSTKVKPNQTCLFCCHKHLAAALALYNQSILEQSNLLRIASQIQLAAWHFDQNYIQYVKKCKNIIDKILNFNYFKDDLILLTEQAWNLYKEQKQKTQIYLNTDISKLEGFDQNYRQGMLCVSNAVQLFNYQNDYKDVNMSYVIGQLTLASWHFQNKYSTYSQRCRIIYNKINLDAFDVKELISFRDFLWKKYKKEYGKTIFNVFNEDKI